MRQILCEGLDVETKSMVMQKGFMNFDYKLLCSEILARADLLAPRDVVLSQSNDVIMGTSSLEPTLSLATDNAQEKPETPHPAREQEQQWSEAEWVAHLDALGKDKAKGKGKGKAGVDECSVCRGKGHGS